VWKKLLAVEQLWWGLVFATVAGALLLGRPGSALPAPATTAQVSVAGAGVLPNLGVYRLRQEYPGYAILAAAQPITAAGATAPVSTPAWPVWFYWSQANVVGGTAGLAGVVFEIQLQDPGTQVWVPLSSANSGVHTVGPVLDTNVHLVAIAQLVGTWRVAYSLAGGATSATITIAAVY
jgi:hypothetical protein